MEQLIAMGFEDAVARQAWELSGGNQELALDLLLSGSFTVPPAPRQERGAVNDERVTVLGISQYTFSEMGSSACTAISCSAIAALLKALDADSNVHDSHLLGEAIINGVSAYSSAFHDTSTGSSDHISVDEYFFLSESMKNDLAKLDDQPIQGHLNNSSSFQDLFARARELAMASAHPNRHIGIVITKPPETICVILPPPVQTDRSRSYRYAFFDSHSRPEYGCDGSYLVTSDTVGPLLSRLRTLFPTSTLGMHDQDTNYLQLMYNSFEGAIFQSK